MLNKENIWDIKVSETYHLCSDIAYSFGTQFIGERKSSQPSHMTAQMPSAFLYPTLLSQRKTSKMAIPQES